MKNLVTDGPEGLTTNPWTHTAKLSFIEQFHKSDAQWIEEGNTFFDGNTAYFLEDAEV